MPKLSPIKPKSLLQLLNKAGFYIHHQTGSHAQIRHRNNDQLRVTVPRHDKFDIPPSIINKILKQAKLTREEYFQLLKK